MNVSEIFRRIDNFDFSREKNLIIVAELHQKYLFPFLGGPSELYARTHAQYQGLCHYRSVCQRYLRRAASLLLILRFFLQNIVFWLRCKPISHPQPVDGVKTGGPLQEYELPQDLQGTRIVEWAPTPSYLDWREVLETFRGLAYVSCWEPEVYYKSLQALAFQAGIFQRYSPKFVVMYKEYDYVGSLLTRQCRNHGVAAYNVMHGDKTHSAMDMFFTFDRYYVWHKGYGQIAKDLEADPGEVVVFTPDRMRPPLSPLAPTIDILVVLPTFFLTQTDCDVWVETLETITNHWKVRVRPHPRFPPRNKKLRDYLARNKLEVSDPKTERAIEAIRQARTVVGYHSTMLIEAHFQGAQVFCIRNSCLEQILEHHPFFVDEAFRKVALDSLLAELEAYLHESPR